MNAIRGKRNVNIDENKKRKKKTFKIKMKMKYLKVAASCRTLMAMKKVYSVANRQSKFTILIQESDRWYRLLSINYFAISSCEMKRIKNFPGQGKDIRYK